MKIRFILVLAAILGSCSQLFAQGQNFPGGGVSSINPATVAPNNKDIYVSPSCGTQPNCKTIVGDVKVSYTGTISSGSPNFSCSNTDATCAFTQADVGKQILITNGCSQGGSCLTGADVQFTSKTTKTTIATITSATGGTMSQNASGNISGTAVIAWGTPDGANLAAAYTALTSGARGTCGTLELPNAIMFTNQALFINGPSSCFTDVGLNRQGVLIKGVGISSTWIIPTNDFNFASCTGPDGAHSVCFGDNGSTTFAGGTIIQDLSIMGLGQSLTGTTHAVSVMGMESNSFMYNVNCVGWGGGATNMRGLTIGNLGIAAVFVSAYNIQFDGCGSIGLLHQGQGPFYLTGGSYFGDNLVQAVQVSGGTGTYLVSTGNGYGPIFPTGGAAIMDIGAGAKVFSSGDTIGFGGCNGVAATANVYAVSSNTQVWLEHATIGSGCTSAIWADTGTTGVHVRDSLVTGSTNSLKTSAGTQIFDDGGNTFSGSVSNAGNIIGEFSANGLPLTAAKLVLSAGWGTTAAVTALSGGNAPIGFTVTNSGTGQGASPTITYTFPTPYLVAPLSCTALQTGGTNATGTFTSSSLSTTGVTFTFSLTPTASSTEIIQVSCVTP